MKRELLEKPFPPDQIRQREGLYGDRLDYIEGSVVIQRLNDAFDAHWNFEVIDHRVYDHEIVVLGRLTAEGIAKCQFGKTKITRIEGTNEEVSVGDDLKAAATDALKKCATLFGVGLHLYLDNAPNGDGASSRQGNGRREETAPRANGEGQNSGQSAGHDGGSSRLSAKQLSAIFGIARSKGWSNKAVRDFTQEMFGKMPDFLTRKEASAVIDHLNGGDGRA